MDIGINLSINGSNVIGSTGLTPPLDDYTGAQTAYSIARKLRTAYAGSAIRVRTDNTDTVGVDLVTNGGFDTDTNWFDEATDHWDRTTGVALGDGTQTNILSMYQGGYLILGATYQVTYDVVTISAGSTTINAGYGGVGTARTSTGTYTEIIVCGGNTNLIMKASVDFIGSIDNIVVKKVSFEADIGFDADGNLDETALLAHCGSNSGYITTAYDQSGNSNDWTQSTANLQPRIVNAGTIDKVNGKPAMLSDATALSQDYISSSITSVDPSSTFIVCQTNTDRSCGFGAGGATSRYVGYIRNASASRPDINAGTPTYTVNSVAQSSTRQALYDSMLSNQVVLSVIEVDMSDANWNTLNSQVAQFDSFKPYDYQQETILYNSDMTSDRASIEANINEYYSIY